MENETSAVAVTINQSLNFETISALTEEDNYLQWFLYIYIGNIFLGTLFNLISTATLIKHRNQLDGFLQIICQLSANDIVQCGVSLIELWTLRSQTWKFGDDFCAAFSGTEIFSNTLTFYLIVALNCHTIALCNSKPDAGNKNNSSECLVIKKSREEQTENSRSQSVSVLMPCFFVWLTCASLCVPQLTLSATFVSADNSTAVCTIVDPYYSKLLLNMLIVFRLYTPQVLAFIALVILVRKFFYKNEKNLQYQIVLSIVLNLFYMFTSSGRNISFALLSYNGPNARNFQMPPLNGYFRNFFVNLLLSALHYSGVFVRPMLYAFLLPQLREMLRSNYLPCLIKNS